jgi:hypothetical protein
VADALGAVDTDALGATDGASVGVGDAVGLGVGLAWPTLGSVVLRLETKKPRKTARRIVPITATIEMTESRSVG